GKTSYDADNRPLLVMRSNLWASGYDVDGTDQTSLGQFSGRVQQTYKHFVPRFFVPEHGTMFTLALVLFPRLVLDVIRSLYLNGFLLMFNISLNILCRVSLFLSMALCLLLRLFVFRLLRLKRFSTLTLKVLWLIPILLATLFCMATCRRVKFL